MPIFKHVGHCSVAFLAHSGVVHEYSNADILYNYPGEKKKHKTNRFNELKSMCLYFASFASSSSY